MWYVIGNLMIVMRGTHKLQDKVDWLGRVAVTFMIAAHNHFSVSRVIFSTPGFVCAMVFLQYTDPCTRKATYLNDH